MTKGNLVATSLVGAIPAGGLAYLTVMAFMQHADKMATMLQVVTGLTLLCSVVIALSPVAILLFSKSGGAAAAPAAAAEAPAKKKSKDTPADEEVAEAVDDLDAELEANLDAEPLTDEDDAVPLTDDEGLSLSGFDDSLEDTSPASDDEAFAFDDDGFEFEDDEKKN